MGSLVVDKEMQTNIPGVFAVGDLLCTHIKQAVIATADGVIAAIAVDKYVHGRQKLQTDGNRMQIRVNEHKHLIFWPNLCSSMILMFSRIYRPR